MKETSQRPVTARQLAALILLKWEAFSPTRRPALARVAEDFFSARAYCPERDRAFIQEIIFGVVRWLRLLDWHIDSHLISPKKRLSRQVRVHLRIGAFQILFLDRVPCSAAVNEAVRGVKLAGHAWASGLVNVVLRRLAERRDTLGLEAARSCDDRGIEVAERLAIETSHPSWMVRMWIERYGFKGAQTICRANNIQAPLTIRVNTLVIERDEVLKSLAGHGIDASPGQYAPEAIMIRGYRGSPARIPGFRQGWFQVQDEAAQLVSYCLAPRPQELILDACAGPGGKTTHIAQLIGDQGVVEATDRNRARLRLLEENQKRLGIKCISIIPYESLQARPSKLKGRYHHILVDAPCSGLGVIRRHPDIKWRLNQSSLSGLASKQGSLLSTLAPLVRPGGTMVYATCSLEPEETTEVVERFLSSHPGWEIVGANELLPGPASKLVSKKGFFVHLPCPDGPDGFFAAVLHSTQLPIHR